ncbi:FAFR435Wp [Eremothecium gossypii FDAG1]|nr:FAFR435Wp [Eremothecium gossypii FDAG1]
MMARRIKASHWRRYVFFAIPLLIGGLFLLRFVSISNSKDLQTVLQSLPTELRSTLDLSRTKEDEMMGHFEQFMEEVVRKQEDQIRRLDRERKALEKKLQELKRPASHSTLREQLAAVHEYGTTKKFPAYVWQTWMYSGADDRMDNRLRDYEQKWGKKNPGFVHEIVNDDTAKALVHYLYASIPEVIEAYNVLPSKILRADFFKYLILLARGGVYADIDTNPHQPVPNWIPENVSPTKIGMIIGIENDAKTRDWRSSFIRRLQFATWVIQAKPGHPIIREVVAKITEETLRRKAEGSLNSNLRDDKNIMSWTGSGAWTDVVFTYFNDYVQSGILQKITWKDFHKIPRPKLVGDVLVLPQFSFNAPTSQDSSAGDKNFYYASHEGMKSWKE